MYYFQKNVNNIKTRTLCQSCYKIWPMNKCKNGQINKQANSFGLENNFIM